MDLIEILDYIKSDSELNAQNIFQKIEQKAEELINMPQKGRTVPEFKIYNIDFYREIIVSPWRIICKIEDHRVFILIVIDARRDLSDLLFRKVDQIVQNETK